MKILHLIQRYPPAIGGSEQWAALLTREQVRLGHEVEVFTLAALSEDEYWHGPSQKSLVLPRVREEDGVLVRRFPLSRINPLGLRFARPPEQTHSAGDGNSRGRRLPAPPRTLLPWLALAGPHSLPLYRALTTELRSAQILHLHALPFAHNHAGTLLARAARVPAAFTPHFHPGDASHEGFPQRSLLRSADAVFAVSDFEKRALEDRGVSGEKITVTGNCIQSPALLETPASPQARERLFGRLGVEPRSPLVVYLGRKMPQKGVGLLLEAAARIAQGAPEARLVLAGPSSPWWEGARSGLPTGLRRVVLDAGEITEEEKAALLQSAKLLVCPSSSEAYGIVFLEAWAAGIPVVGARAGAIPEVVGEGGLLFLPGDARDLVDQILRLLREPELARRLAQSGRAQMAARPTAEQIAVRVDEAYQRILTK